MTTFRNAFNIAIVFALGLALSGCSYNRFTGQEEQVKTALAEVQNQLQRRNDLIPNLVETVKGYASQERDIFTAARHSGALPSAEEAVVEIARRRGYEARKAAMKDGSWSGWPMGWRWRCRSMSYAAPSSSCRREPVRNVTLRSAAYI